MFIKCVKKNKQPKNQETMQTIKNNKKSKKIEKLEISNDIKQTKNNETANKHFIETQFHTDYRDTLNAIDVLIPRSQIIFNDVSLPIINSTEFNMDTIKQLVDTFMEELNKKINSKTKNKLNDNWHDYMPEKPYDNQYNDNLEILGIPSSLYDKPAEKSYVKLIKIDDVRVKETEKEIEYSIYLIIQKLNVSDQMVLLVKFIVGNQDVNLDRNFFSKDEKSYETIVTLEDINVLGFLTNYDKIKQSDLSFYDIEMPPVGTISSTAKILKQMNDLRR